MGKIFKGILVVLVEFNDAFNTIRLCKSKVFKNIMTTIEPN